MVKKKRPVEIEMDHDPVRRYTEIVRFSDEKGLQFFRKNRETKELVEKNITLEDLNEKLDFECHERSENLDKAKDGLEGAKKALTNASMDNLVLQKFLNAASRVL